MVGDTPTIGALERFIKAQWNFVAKPKIFYNNDGYFVVKFNTIDDGNEVIYSGPHIFNNRPMIIKAWAANFDFNEEVLRTIPLWVKFPKLPLNCWCMESLSRISSVLGNLLYADECTSKLERISFARVLIEMDVTKPLPNTIIAKDPNGRIFEQTIWYDWQPEYCNTCLQLGHICTTGKTQKRPEQQVRDKPKKQILEWHVKGAMQAIPLKIDEPKQAGNPAIKMTTKNNTVVTQKKKP